MPPPPGECDLAIVGGGILGLAVARELPPAVPGARRGARARGAERRHRPDRRTTAASSTPASTTRPARSRRGCAWRGARAMYAYCEERGIAHERCGKLIVARDESELGASTSSSGAGARTVCPGCARLRRGDRARSSRTPAGRRAALARDGDRGLRRGGASARRRPRAARACRCVTALRAPRRRAAEWPACALARGGETEPASRSSAPAPERIASRSTRARQPTRASSRSAAATSSSAPSAGTWCAR